MPMQTLCQPQGKDMALKIDSTVISLHWSVFDLIIPNGHSWIEMGSFQGFWYHGVGDGYRTSIMGEA